ncbi:NAD(P)-dependent oxidoreductase [Celeribacter sp.]|uniref:NAD(P)-dependent oxidoreductase n=1 Tax=Celeribacter sp. TaxID=1890673 RepID=UPI003A9308A3
MQNEIGIAGAGRMGTALAKRLLELGHSVTIWNRTVAGTTAAVEAGATVAADLDALARCEIILISLTDADAVSSVVGKLAASGIGGRLVIDMSTHLPSETQAIAEVITSSGGEFIECPVGGTVGPALKGQLLGMAGGTSSAFARAQPILERLCKRVEHLGPVGNGARMKLAVNLPLAIYWQTLGEALSLLGDAGVSPETAISLIADSSAGPTVLKNRAQVIIDTLNGTDQPGTFDIAGLNKDLRLALTLAKSESRELPLARAVEPIYKDVLNAGLGGFDGASLTKRSST